MIRYNNISRPVHDPSDPLPKIWGSRPSVPGLTPLDSNEKEAFSRRNELSRGGLRRMKMPHEKNGENTDLKCDIVLCRTIPVSTGILPHSLPEWAFRARPGLWRNCLCPKVARIAEQKFGSR